MLKKYWIAVQEKDRGKRLDQVIAEQLPQSFGPISKSAVRKLIVAGAVYLNRSRVRIASKAVVPGVKIEVWIDSNKMSGEARSQLLGTSIQWNPDWVLFEDSDLLVVNKPAGIPTQPTLDEARLNLYELCKKYLKSQDPQAYLALHHRLDRDTSGVMVFVKDRRSNAAVANAFQSHTAQKRYLAVVEESDFLRSSVAAHSEFSVDNFLGKLPGTGKQSRWGAVRSGGDRALTQFRLLERSSGLALILASPRTGRTHQIRVHLSELGMPIVGDFLYGKAHPKWRLQLHARELSLPHPVTQKTMTWIAPVPKDFSFQSSLAGV